MSFYGSIKVIVNVVIIIIVGIIIWWFYKERHVNNLDKRLGKYSIKSRKNVEHSLFDYINDYYNNIQNKLIKILSKSSFLSDYSKKYEKYIDRHKNKDLNPMTYIAAKFICALLILILVVVTDAIQNASVNFLELVIGFLVGFYILDIILIVRKALIKKTIENDLLQAITIMNNSFKSGRSIVQTIEIVSEELDGPLKLEFQQMVKDLDYGLTLENVFERLEERVKIEELKYISTSLSILNKTGGNIVKVFSSIEKTFFNNRKLDEELKNLTASSNFLYRVLTFIPIIFAAVIYILDPGYFNPLFTNVLGYFILGIVILLYITYIFVVKKIVNIKE